MHGHHCRHRRDESCLTTAFNRTAVRARTEFFPASRHQLLDTTFSFVCSAVRVLYRPEGRFLLTRGLAMNVPGEKIRRSCGFMREIRLLHTSRTCSVKSPFSRLINLLPQPRRNNSH